MPRTYERKEGVKKRQPVYKIKLKAAVKAVLENTAKSFNVPLMTLKRYARKQKEQENYIEYEPNYQQSKIFTDAEEAELAKYLEKASKLLTPSVCPRLLIFKLAYEYAVQNNKPAKKIQKWTNNIATYDWFHGFLLLEQVNT